MVEAIDIVPKNMDAPIDNMDIDNILLQNFLYKPTLSADRLNLEEFKGDQTNPSLTFALINKIMQDLDQYVKSEKSILDNLPNGVNVLNKTLVFSSLGEFILNKQLAEQANKQVNKLLNKSLGQYGNKQLREQLDEWLNKQLDKLLDKQLN